MDIRRANVVVAMRGMPCTADGLVFFAVVIVVGVVMVGVLMFMLVVVAMVFSTT